MIVLKAFCFKIVPAPTQEQAFRRYAGACRWVWNEMLRERKETYNATGKSPSMYAQMRRLTALKRQPETAWLNGVHSQVLQEPIKNLQRAFINFFEKRAKYPTFKRKRRGLGSFSFPQSVAVAGNRVWLPKIGWVRFRKSREIEGTIKRATIRHKARGWYISILCEVEVPDPEPAAPTEETTVGVDLGLNDFAVLSTGERIPNPRHLRKLERKLAHAQRARSRTRKGARRYHKQARKVARLHERITNARTDFLHQLSSRLVAENQGIMVEDLSVQGLARTRLAKSVHDAGWGEFLRQLAYKARWAGKVFHRIDRFFPSSKLHIVCGTLNDLSLSDRLFECQGCGALVDRDLNAALNIKHRGLVEVSPVGQPGVYARGLGVSPTTVGGPG
ncbi:MAG TPA: transposase [Methylomirabilota bacterium]|nr:transposase [Methylomirabilota bacterium]